MSAVPRESAFETLIYTDCRAGQGLRGEVGLQFQAKSSDEAQSAMPVVQRNLLYEAPAKWMRERRPVAEYPPSFAHIWDGCLATAAGVYLGKEVNGSREGNQLTHSIVTREPQSYGLVRPAQLFQAPFWTARPEPTTHCPPIGPDWLPGPFGVDEAQKFATARPRRQQMLVALLSALERVGTPRERRILFLAEDAVPVLRWIATGTLLLPQQRALAIGFKVFTVNPSYASQPVLAVHPSWEATPVTVENDGGYVVFDLVRDEWSEVTPTRHAAEWVRLFCTENPHDVMDAIEAAAASRLPEETAPIVGQAVGLRHSLTLAQAQVVVDWLRESDASLLAEERGGLVDLLTDEVERWPQPILLCLDEVSRSGQVPPDRVAPVRLALIRAELLRACREARSSAIVLPPLTAQVWRDEHQRAAEATVVEALREARPDSFDAVLRVASRFGLRVRISAVAQAAHRFVVDWADHPERDYAVAAWPCRDEIEDLLTDELNRRLTDDAELAGPIGDQWWRRRLAQTSWIASPLDRAVIAAAIPWLDPHERAEWVGKLLDAAATSARPHHWVGEVAGVLWARAAPSHSELARLHRRAPEGTVPDQHIFRQFVGDLTSGELTEKKLELAHHLVDSGLLTCPQQLEELFSAEQRLDTLLQSVEQAEFAEKPPRALIELASTTPHRLLRVYPDRVVGSLLRADAPFVVAAVAAHLPMSVVDDYIRRLAHAVRDQGDLTYVAAAFVLSHWRKFPEAGRRDIEKALVRWVNRASDKRLEETRRRVDLLGRASQWRELVLRERGGNAAIRFKRKLLG